MRLVFWRRVMKLIKKKKERKKEHKLKINNNVANLGERHKTSIGKF